ncbi:hypothetical protein DDJ76_22730 [Mycobacteroides abscessus]|nr:hypothetical protein DDJ76_22730 [Mycobacteroides abscessus]RIS11350.1 hypothetical protein D2E69_22460 [Mycobacteroides abscessus]RIS23545.1 hypothetical protein D2E67_21995 [Mycobacteroides abscessus]
MLHPATLAGLLTAATRPRRGRYFRAELRRYCPDLGGRGSRVGHGHATCSTDDLQLDGVGDGAS